MAVAEHTDCKKRINNVHTLIYDTLREIDTYVQVADRYDTDITSPCEHPYVGRAVVEEVIIRRPHSCSTEIKWVSQKSDEACRVDTLKGRYSPTGKVQSITRMHARKYCRTNLRFREIVHLNLRVNAILCRSVSLSVYLLRTYMHFPRHSMYVVTMKTTSIRGGRMQI
jgi:hypothetical protein